MSLLDHGDQLNDEFMDAAYTAENAQQASENLDDRSEEGTDLFHNLPVSKDSKLWDELQW